MEERLRQIGDWLRPNGEAIYGTHAWKKSAQWSEGTVPHMEEKEFMSDYNISKMVDTPPSGFARVDAFFTAKADAVYAILPRWPEKEFVMDDIGGSVNVTLLETGDRLEAKTAGRQLRIDVPAELRSKLPPRPAYVLKIDGVG